MGNKISYNVDILQDDLPCRLDSTYENIDTRYSPPNMKPTTNTTGIVRRCDHTGKFGCEQARYWSVLRTHIGTDSYYIGTDKKFGYQYRRGFKLSNGKHGPDED